MKTNSYPIIPDIKDKIENPLRSSPSFLIIIHRNQIIPDIKDKVENPFSSISSVDRIRNLPEKETYKQVVQLLAKKLFKVISDAVSGTNEVLSVHKIVYFLNLLQQKVDLLLEETVIAIQILQRFITQETNKDAHVLDLRNVGMSIIIPFILSMKFSRDRMPKNKFFANMFNIPIYNLNKSESSFLRIIDHACWVQEDFSSLIHSYEIE
ncbi:MAG: hypothetical protein EZS28_031146 [Streblomastix strix]|uniref:Uncharacterized protein n=1 Tax=Streblomastix strix TaxID=222440 RepID=A0A5J4URL5_9EUKA|nr:MAG: hypothetical protein EZS28_031146 [Streblomastix strix]